MSKPDPQDENWMAAIRLQGLLERGWTGTFAEWQAAYSRLRADPITLGQLSPNEDDRREAKRHR